MPRKYQLHNKDSHVGTVEHPSSVASTISSGDRSRGKTIISIGGLSALIPAAALYTWSTPPNDTRRMRMDNRYLNNEHDLRMQAMRAALVAEVQSRRNNEARLEPLCLRTDS